MRNILLTIVGLLFFCGFKPVIFERKTIGQTQLNKNNLEKYDSFELYYSYAGLSSGMGSMQPTFKVKGDSFVYTIEQNSYYGKPDKKTEYLCEGTLRILSIDSILNILKDFKDTLVYKTNVDIKSGGIHNIYIKYKKINVTFRLHNASDSTAQKMVDILNSNFPADKQRLWLFDFPD